LLHIVAMDWKRLRSFVRRHRRSIGELSIILVALLTATYWTYEIDVFANEDRMTVKEETIELDEALLLGGLLTLGLLTFRRAPLPRAETRDLAPRSR